MRACFLLVLATSLVCQAVKYNARSTAGAGEGMCPDTQNLRESISQDIHSLINDSVLSALDQSQAVFGTGPGYGACGCGGTGWRRAAYLNMSDPTQICPPAWELITTPRRSCGRPSNADSNTCYSAIFPPQGIQYSQVCGRIIGYQWKHPEAFREFTIDEAYVDGVSLTYGYPRQHIWTFACALDEYPHYYDRKCPCTDINDDTAIPIPSFVGDDYFCETGSPPGQTWRNYFVADDPLWDGQGCSPTSTCCTFNHPPWFCKQLPRPTNTYLEVRICSRDTASMEDTPVELIEIYVK